MCLGSLESVIKLCLGSPNQPILIDICNVADLLNYMPSFRLSRSISEEWYLALYCSFTISTFHLWFNKLHDVIQNIEYFIKISSTIYQCREIFSTHWCIELCYLVIFFTWMRDKISLIIWIFIWIHYPLYLCSVLSKYPSFGPIWLGCLLTLC